MADRFLQLSFEIEGEKQISSALQYIGGEISDFTKPLKATQDSLLKVYSGSQFSSSGSELGTPWQSLSSPYSEWKAKKYPGKGILVRTGKMQKAFKGDLTKFSTTITNPTSYFMYHQSNKPRKGSLPRRVMMKIDLKRQAEIFGYFTKFLNDVASHWGK